MLADIEILMYRQGMIKMWLDSFSNIYGTVRSADERKTLILSAIVDKQRFFKEILQTGFSDAGVEIATLSLGVLSYLESVVLYVFSLEEHLQFEALKLILDAAIDIEQNRIDSFE